jgi:type I restriction enzyme S subunit
LFPKLRFQEFDGAWSNSKIDDIAVVTSGGTPSRSNLTFWDGNIPWVTTSLVDFNIIQSAEEFITQKGLDNSSAKLFPKNTILMAMYGQGITRGKVAILGIDATTNQACAAIKLQSNYDTQFIFQNLMSRYEEIRDLSNDGGQKNLSAGIIKEIEVNYPEKREQIKIASFLSVVDEKISQLTQKHQLLREYKQGMMQKLFSQQIRFKADDGSEFGEWENTVLGDIADIVGGGTPSTNNQAYWSGDVVWLTPSEINQKFIGESKRTISELGVQKSSAKKLPIGTILFTSRATIGEVAIAIAEVTTNQGFQSFISNEKTFNEFLYYWIVNNKKSFIERASGSTFLEISKSKIQPMEISLPCLEEQTKIANFLSAIDQKIEVVAQQIEQAKQWKKGLLQQMFI